MKTHPTSSGSPAVARLIGSAALGGILAAVVLAVVGPAGPSDPSGLAHRGPSETSVHVAFDSAATGVPASTSAARTVEYAALDSLPSASESGVMVEPAPKPESTWNEELREIEALWDQVFPLVESEEHGRAIDLLDDYLEDHPYNVAVREERANALARAGRTAQAEWAYRGLLEDTGSERIRIALAGLLFERGATDRAILVLDDAPAPTPPPPLIIASTGP